jgi:hypothetical protein
MKFRLRTSVVLSKEFEIEAEHLRDATKIVERQIAEDVNLNRSDFELTHIGFDMNDPSIREYNAKMCKEILAEQRATQQ